MANPKFTLGVNELQFTRGLKYPVRKPRQKLQVVDRTAAGTPQVEDLGAADIRTLPLVFRNMPKADYDALETFFDTVADGAVNEFTYTDPNGTEYTVIFRTTKLDWPEKHYQVYDGELLLEIVD